MLSRGAFASEGDVSETVSQFGQVTGVKPPDLSSHFNFTSTKGEQMGNHLLFSSGSRFGAL